MKIALLPLCLLLACSSTPVPTIEGTTFSGALPVPVDLDASVKLPSGMYIRDLTDASTDGGVQAAVGQTITTYYTGWLADGTQFDTNTTTGFQFRLGEGEVIPGWDYGIPGMYVGGQRQLIIPPDLGYGANGSGPIPPNAIMVFTVTLVSIP